MGRGKLRKEIFRNAQDRLWLEGLLHPIIRELMAEQLKKLKAPYCIVQIPLLVDRAPNSLIQRILLVDTDKAIQLQRTKQRDQLDALTIQSIIDAQPTRAALLDAADDVIINSGSLKDLKKQVLALHEQYLK